MGRGHGAKPESTKELYIKVMADPTLTTDKAKIDALNGAIAPSTYWKWKDDKELQQRIKKKIVSNFSTAEATMREALINEGKKGNVPALKLYFEMMNEYVSRIEQNGDISINIKVEE